MNKINYNGFASEEQYEAAMNIIKNAIDEYTDTIRVEFKNNDIIVEVETKELNHYARYFFNTNGVFYVNLESQNMPSVECKIMAALNKCAYEVFSELWKISGKDRLKKLLNGDTSVVTYEEYSNDAEKDTKKLNDIMSKDKITVGRDLIEGLPSYVTLFFEDAIPVFEQHYGVKFTSRGNKYYYFTREA